VKITYLRLKHFAAIKSILQMKELVIDFSKMKNPICLFLGPIGSCKTYIMSQLQPFANMGNVDVRHGSDMIIEDKDGEKEIHYQKDNGDYYKIVHHYLKTRKTGSRTIRSYIEKNGTEMNPSGLVTQFNQLIEIEFGIDISFIRILRLGSNVNGLVGQTAANRKDFAVRLLREVDEYIKDYKTATITCRELNSELNLVVDKLSKIGDDESTESRLLSELKDIELEIESLTKSKENAVKELALQKGRLEESCTIPIPQLRERINELIVEGNTAYTILNEIKEKMDNGRVFVYEGKLSDLIDALQKEKGLTEVKLAEVSGTISGVSMTLDSMRNDAIDLDNKVRSLKELDELTDIESDIELAKKFDEQYKKYYDTFDPKCTKSDLLHDIALMQTILDMIQSTREFSSPARMMYFDAYNEKDDPRKYCYNKLVKLRTELSLSELEGKATMTNIEPPEECKFYKGCMIYRTFSKRETRSPQSIREDVNLLEEALKVCDCMANIEVMLRTRKHSLPYKVEFGRIVEDVVKGTIGFFDFAEASKMVTFLEKFDEWKANKVKLEKLETERDYLLKQQTAIDTSIIEQRKNLLVKISDMEKELGSLKKKRKKLKGELDLAEEYITSAKEMNSLQEGYREAKSELDRTDSELKSLSDKIKLLNSFDELSKATEANIQMIQEKIKELESSQFELKVKIRDYQKLREQKAKLAKKFKHAELVRNAVSSNKGIPLLYLNAHFGRAKTIANRVISAVAGDSFQLEMPIINENEFRIPYTKNGVVIPDIAYASQGETSIGSLALSFGLIEEFVGTGGYNIMLLDEVDGPLDKDIRAQFLRMLEMRMTDLNATQMFMITHSGLFENYPVDAFVTIDKDGILDSYLNVNKIN